MIGRIRGTLLEKQPPELVIDVGGLGYEVLAPISTCARLPAIGEGVELFTHFQVREDAQQLFGFWNREDRTLFRTLIKVSGVGPKMALAILSGMESDDFVRCVQHDDVTALTRLPGVGKKTAERLIVEMRDRFKEWRPEAALDAAVTGGASAGAAATGPGQLIADAESALIALGYKPQEAARSVNAVYDESVNTSEELIRRALKGMAPTR